MRGRKVKTADIEVHHFCGRHLWSDGADSTVSNMLNYFVGICMDSAVKINVNSV